MKRYGHAFMDTQASVPVPHLVAVIFACLVGAAQALNQTTFALSSSWHAYLGLGLVVLAHAGVRPLIGTQFRDALGLPAWVSHVITTIVAAGTAALGVLPVNGGHTVVVVQIVLATGTTMLVALGFGPAASSQVAESAKRRRTAKRAAATRAARARSTAA